MGAWINQTSWLGNPGISWLGAAIGAIVGYLVVYALARFLTARFTALANRHPRRQGLRIAAAILGATRGWIILLLAIIIAITALPAPEHVVAHRYIYWAIVALIGVQAALWVSRALVGWLKRATPEGSMAQTNPIIFGILTWSVELLVWTTLLLVLLSQAGVHIGAFVASLGVGGIAIAMAAKNVLEDLFASIAIGLDKPFEVGEFIAFGNDLGTVKRVGIKSTRIESLSGEELAISNAQLLQQLVHNYSRRQERRIVFGFHVPLDTSREKVEQVAQRVNAIIDEQDNTRRDRGFMEAIELEGFRYEFVYYVLTPEYNDYVAAQQAINLKIMDAMAALEVPFAMPSRAVHARPVTGDGAD